jgi:hypothetical protein
VEAINLWEKEIAIIKEHRYEFRTDPYGISGHDSQPSQLLCGASSKGSAKAIR